MQRNSINERTLRLIGHAYVGALYASKDSARYGLELSYDSILRGKEGVSHRAKVRNKWLSLVDAPPVDGN